MDPRLEPLRAQESPLKRHLGFVALLGEELRRLGAELPVVVGGHALEIYTGGHYATADIDLVAGDHRALATALEGLGLTRRGRHWLEPELGIAIEAPGTEMPERLTEVAVDGRPVRVLAVEELILDRLSAFVHWRSARDGDWAEMLLRLHGDRLDQPFLDRRAREEDVAAALLEVRSRIRGGAP